MIGHDDGGDDGPSKLQEESHETSLRTSLMISLLMVVFKTVQQEKLCKSSTSSQHFTGLQLPLRV